MSSAENLSKTADYDTSDPEWKSIIGHLKNSRFRDIQNGNFEVLKHDP